MNHSGLITQLFYFTRSYQGFIFYSTYKNCAGLQIMCLGEREHALFEGVLGRQPSLKSRSQEALESLPSSLLIGLSP